MASRKIQNAGVEINEFDRSQYADKVDYSLPNSPTCMIAGFADKGEDLALTWINSKNTLDDTYGQPTNEYETYFYNAAYEILNRGATCIAVKMPYMNFAYQKYMFAEYTISQLSACVPSDNDAENQYQSAITIYSSLNSYLSEKYSEQNIAFDISNVCKMQRVCEDEYNKAVQDDDRSAIDQLSAIRESLIQLVSAVLSTSKYAALYLNDNFITSYMQISNSTPVMNTNVDTIENLDAYLTNTKRVKKNTIRIYDMTRARYDRLQSYIEGCVSSEVSVLSDDGSVHQETVSTNDCLGIVPVITTAQNAMFFQQILDFSPMSADANYQDYNQLSGFQTLSAKGVPVSADFHDVDMHVSLPFASLPTLSIGIDGSNYDSLSRRSSMYFPLVQFRDASHFDPKYLKQIGVCVFKAYEDLDNNGKMSFQLLESFVGSLDRTAHDPITQANIFIDDVVNSQSQFIRLFSNVDKVDYEKASILTTSLQKAQSIGFYEACCTKDINYANSVIQPLTTMFDRASNRNELPLDIVVDAGMSNIAQLALVEGGTIHAGLKPYVADIIWKFGTYTVDTSGWKLVLSKFDNFCKCMRKDCMFLADGIRGMCLDGNVKYIRKTSPQSTVANTIIPRFKYIANALNSSYSAGYCDWFYQRDYSSKDFFWCPPSIKAAGVCIYCDTYFHPWSAPAGLTRGVLTDVVDVAFNPLDLDAGQIYGNQWNYAMSYPIDGIVIEGHKTFQSEKTALDRINVRRLMLSLEKQIDQVARRFVYESNTPYHRQMFVDECVPILENAVGGDGIKEYAIKCDDELNTPQVIENNEMRCKIAVKPVKVVDYIVIDMVCTRQGANVNEEVLR